MAKRIKKAAQWHLKVWFPDGSLMESYTERNMDPETFWTELRKTFDLLARRVNSVQP